MNFVIPIEELKRDVAAQKREFEEHLKIFCQPMDTTSLQLGALLFFATILGYAPKPKDGTLSYESMLKDPGYGVKGFFSFKDDNPVGCVSFSSMISLYNGERSLNKESWFPHIQDAYANRLLKRVTLQYVKSRKKTTSPFVKAQCNWVKFHGEYA